MEHLIKPSREGYNFDYGHFIKSAWNLMSKDAGSFIGMTLLFLIITFTASWLPYVSVISNLLSACLYAGFYIFARNLKLGENSAGDFFKGFSFIGNIFLHNLVLFLFFLPLLIPIFSQIPIDNIQPFLNGDVNSFTPEDFNEMVSNQETISNPGIVAFCGFLLFFLAIYLGVSYTFVIPLIVDAKQSFWSAMELSRKTVGKRFFTIFLFWILLGIAGALITLVTCAVGILFIIPFYYCLIFEMYDQIFKPYSDSDVLDFEIN